MKEEYEQKRVLPIPTTDVRCETWMLYPEGMPWYNPHKVRGTRIVLEIKESTYTLLEYTYEETSPWHDEPYIWIHLLP
jgi:hypothetical protein